MGRLDAAYRYGSRREIATLVRASAEAALAHARSLSRDLFLKLDTKRGNLATQNGPMESCTPRVTSVTPGSVDGRKVATRRREVNTPDALARLG